MSRVRQVSRAPLLSKGQKRAESHLTEQELEVQLRYGLQFVLRQ